MARQSLFRILSLLFLMLLCGVFCLSHTWAQDNNAAAAPGMEAVVPAPSVAVKEAASNKIDAKPGNTDNVTFDFKDADIQNVLKIISYKSGVNIISSPDVTGVVSIRLVNVPWEEALDAILAAHNFGYEWLNDKIIMVGSLEKLSLKKKARLEERSQEKKVELEEKKANIELSARENKEAVENLPLDTQAFVLNFSKVDEIKTAVQNLISGRGKIMLEPRTNTLIITDTKVNLAKIEDIIKKLDRMTPQVLIEAKIIETTLGNAEKLGIDWTLRITARGAARPITWPYMSNSKGINNDYLPLTQQPSTLERTTTSQTDAQTGNIINTTATETLFHRLVNGFPEVPANLFTFGTLNFTEMAAVMEILSQRTDSKILSNPRIVTLNNREAKILVGSIVPIPNYEYSKDTGTRVVSGYTDQEIGVGLSVTPNINERDYITLNVRPTIDQIIGYTGPNNERPIVSTRNAETNVMIKDGQTLVIGGLISEKKSKYKKKIPILGDIPGLDYLFSKKEDTVERTELLIFISPHIIREGDFREANLKETEKIEKEMLEDARLTLNAEKKDSSLVGKIKQVVK